MKQLGSAAGAGVSNGHGFSLSPASSKLWKHRAEAMDINKRIKWFWSQNLHALFYLNIERVLHKSLNLQLYLRSKFHGQASIPGVSGEHQFLDSFPEEERRDEKMVCQQKSSLVIYNQKTSFCPS